MIYYFAEYAVEENIHYVTSTLSFVARIVVFYCCLQTFYVEKFGAGVVEIVKDSNSVEPDKLDPNKVKLIFKVLSITKYARSAILGVGFLHF